MRFGKHLRFKTGKSKHSSHQALFWNHENEAGKPDKNGNSLTKDIFTGNILRNNRRANNTGLVIVVILLLLFFIFFW